MARGASDIRIRELKDTITELNKTIRELNESLDAAKTRENEKDQQIANLKEQLDFMTKKLFGKKSEKNLDIPGQLELFNEAEVEQNPSVPDEIKSIAEGTVLDEKTPRKVKKTDKDRYAGIPVTKEFLDKPDEVRLCPVCGTALEPFGEQFVRREVEIIPGRIRIIEYYSRTYSCPKCKAKGLVPKLVKGSEGKAHMLYGMASSSTVAWVMYQKYANSMPLYRQEKDWERLYNLKISRATLANWVIQNADAYLRPVAEYFYRIIRSRNFIMADETTVQVLHEKDRRPQSKSYMWVYRTGERTGHPVIAYKYSETRAGDHAKDFLGDFSGYIMCDGYSGYNKLVKAKRCSCWAHIRRYLIDAVPKGKINDYSEPAVQGLLYVQKLFDKERLIRNTYKDPDIIRDKRIEMERDILDGFWSWLDRQKPVKGSRLDKAVIYIRNRKVYLETYLEDGHCSFTNNLTEQGCKSFVVGRKNWLFSDRPIGAEVSSIIYTIVETAKLNQLNPYYYLRYLLNKCPAKDMSDEELEKICPWSTEARTETENLYLKDQDPDR